MTEPTFAELALSAQETAGAAWIGYYAVHRPLGAEAIEGIREAGSRMRLVRIVVCRIMGTHGRLLQAWGDGTSSELANVNLVAGDLRLDTETFYWQCHRLSSLIRQLPGLSQFQATGVRDVRNNLIEHPENSHSRVLFNSFTWTPELGPQIKAVRPVGSTQVFMDAGLFVNAKQFYDQLSRRLAIALSR